jgi:hypothetical protein
MRLVISKLVLPSVKFRPDTMTDINRFSPQTLTIARRGHAFFTAREQYDPCVWTAQANRDLRVPKMTALRVRPAILETHPCDAGVLEIEKQNHPTSDRTRACRTSRAPAPARAWHPQIARLPQTHRGPAANVFPTCRLPNPDIRQPVPGPSTCSGSAAAGPARPALRPPILTQPGDQ